MYTRCVILITISAFILSAQLAFSQKNHLPGWIITREGDTLKGSIDYRNWGKNPDSVLFLDQATGLIRSFQAKEITRMFVNNEYYNSAVVKINERITDMETVVENYTPVIRQDTALLLSVVEGKKSLYHLKLANREDYYFYDDADTVRTYWYSTYVTIKDQQRYLRKDPKYAGQMILYFADCPEMKDDIYTAKYTMSSMRKVYRKYYDCIDKKPDYILKETKKYEFGLLAGTSLTKLKFREVPSEVSDEGFPVSVNFTTGIFLNFIIPRNFERWSIYNELNLTSYYTENTNTSVVNENNYTEYTTQLGERYMKLFSSVRYSYPFQKVTLLGNIGVSYGISVSGTDIIISEQYFYGQWRTSTEPAYLGRYQEIGMAAGIGLKYWHVTFETRYDKALLAHNSFPTYRFCFLLAYTF